MILRRLRRRSRFERIGDAAAYGLIEGMMDETSRELLMTVVDLTDREQIEKFLKYLRMIESMGARQAGLRSIRVGIDPIDSAVKFSVDYSTWSPPITGRIEEM